MEGIGVARLWLLLVMGGEGKGEGVGFGYGRQDDDSVLKSVCIKISTILSNSCFWVPLYVNGAPCSKKSCKKTKKSH